ncbi:MAG TPA: T9SS type A sorting domain-containing protein, partial [Saprospiraceae bacterium]|nr:T9SS type A sorting domain-containing protein [Saprospiraceae bacterium]
TENRYGFTDTEVKSGQTYYYRLRQTDFDGAETLSDIQAVRMAGAADDILVYPNPALDELYVQWSQPDEKGVQLEVLDVQGRPLGLWAITESVHRVDTRQWASGQYILRVVTGGKVWLKRVLIRR